jgi:hypothetical protein
MKHIFLAIVIGLLAPLLAGAAEIRIPAQPLGASLKELGTLMGVEMVFQPKSVEGRQAPELRSPFTFEGALDTLLAGTGLTYQVRGTRGIEITGDPMDEVTVRGQREKLSAMLREFTRIERQFYDEYNKVNTEPEYEILCGSESHGLGGAAQQCEPAFVRKAMQQAWSGYLDGHAFVSPWIAIKAKEASYQRNMEALVQKNPKLLELLMKRSAMGQRYFATRKNKFAGGKVVVWD